MTIEELIEVIKDATVPDLWTTQHIADYIHRDVDAVRNRIINIPGFPQPIRLPTDSGTRGRPLWKSTEIKEWVSKFQEKRAA